LGGRLLGWRTVCAVEAAAYPRRVLLARQRDGILDPFPIWDDVRTFDGHPWRGHVDVISGGFPCQDISAAGKGAGITGKKSGLWSEMARIIGEVRPPAVFVENSPLLVRRGLNVVLGDLASMGYDARWCVLGARHVGAPHQRDRLWLLATDPDSERLVTNERRAVPDEERRVATEATRRSMVETGTGVARGKFSHTHSDSEPTQPIYDAARTISSVDDSQLANANSAQRQRDGRAKRVQKKYANASGAGWWKTEPTVGRVADGLAHRMDRLRATGNGQVPSVAAVAWCILNDNMLK